LVLLVLTLDYKLTDTMILNHILLCVVLCSQQALSAPKHTAKSHANDILDYVDPLIGSQNGGNVFSGATLPYGMAKGSRQNVITATCY
jgi:putative alpha-1,2-mannosidase